MLMSQPCQLKVIDSETRNAIPFAMVKISGPDNSREQKFLADSFGNLKINTAGKSILRAEALGYKRITDTVFPGIIREIFMEPDHVELGAIVVTGHIVPQSADKSIYRINVIDQSIIEKKAANTLADALRGELAFNSQSDGALGDFIRIQGLTGEHIKLLVDGLPVTGRVGGIIDLGQINSGNIEQIEVVEGPMSVVYGSNAMAGVINIITKTPDPSSVYAQLQAYYETVGIYNISGAASTSFRNQSISLNIGRNFNNGWSPDKNSRSKYYKPKEQYTGDFTYKYQAKKISFSAQSNIMREQLRDLDDVHTSFVNVTNDSAYITYLASDYYYFTTRSNSQTSFIYKPNNRSALQIQAGYSYYNKSKKCMLKDLVTLHENLASNASLSDTSIFHMIPLRAVYSNIFNNKYEIQSGIDYNYEQSQGERTGGEQNITDAALFSTFIYKPYRNFSIQPGLRVIYNSDFEAPLVYSMNVQYNIGRFNLRASYGKGFRAPSLKELYMEFVDNNHHIFGNEDLKAETGVNISFSAGASFNPGSVRLIPSFSLFQNTIYNAIQLALDPDRAGWGYYFNISESKFKTVGTRVELKTYLGDYLWVNSGINILGKTSLIQTNEFKYSEDIVLQISYSIPQIKLESSVQYKHNGKYYDYAGTFDSDFKLNGVQEQFIEGYNLLDISLTRRFFDNKCTLSAGIKNIFDVTTIDSSGLLNAHSGGDFTLAGYGRSFFVKLIYRFHKDEK